MKRTVLAGLAILGALMLTACDDGPSNTNSPVTKQITTGTVRVDGYDIVLIKVRMDDGTVCVVSKGDRSGGVSCDWSRQK